MAGNSLSAFILFEQLWASFDESIERIQKNPWKPTASMIVSLGAAVSGWQPFRFHTTTNDSWREPQKSIVCYQGEKKANGWNIQFYSSIVILNSSCWHIKKVSKRNKYSRSASRWGSLSCRWWPGWRSRLHCTRGRCRSGWSCWWTACRCCWCSRRSCSCPSPALRSQRPTRRWSPSRCDPGAAGGAHSGGHKQDATFTCKLTPGHALSWTPIATQQIQFQSRVRRGFSIAVYITEMDDLEN